MNLQWIETTIAYANQTASIIALIGVIIAVLTLREMQKQRQKAYEPQLFLPNITVYMQKNDNGTPCILKSDWKREIKSLPFFDLELHNIGLGAANTISIIWRYDKRAIIAKLEDLAAQTKLVKE